MNVAAVANEVGYANAAKFASAFKRKFGITTSACRLGEKVSRWRGEATRSIIS
ncbi:MAG: hypothetical protein IGS54_05350 [Elainella sp. C42_A2020_010]|nr:hypothetical protein [Elainella sp. C42_A2020_010]RNJ68529.1 MAG: hypothetical protein EDM05_15650 [Leptolyngbya sp. IPPAS B-1204]